MDPHPRPARQPVFRAMALASALALGLSACAGEDDARDRTRATRGAQDADLPAPERTAGSVTGMPDAPGPGTAPLQSVGGVPGEPAGVASIEPGVAPPTRDVPEPSLAFEPPAPEVAPIDVAPVDPRTGNALPATAPVPPDPPRPPAPPAAAADPDATASTTIVVDVPAQRAPPAGETDD